MNIVFAGTPEFAQVALEAVISAGHAVPLVLTQPDRPSGRGMKLHPSPVKASALAHGIAVAQPRSLRLDGKYPNDAQAARAQLEAVRPDVMVVAAYGLILPQWVLGLPARGCLNIHASLLPRWRGAAPIHRAIEAGDAQTGITIMQMDAGLDTGDMLLEAACAIAPDDRTGTLHDRLAVLGGRLIVDAGAEHIAKCADKLQRLIIQRQDLGACFDQLLADAQQGRAYFKVYRQFKMYNDPTLNPYLYGTQQRVAAGGVA